MIIQKTFIIANWKCNPTKKKEAQQLFEKITDSISPREKMEIIFCPPFVWLPELNFANKKNFKLGAQDCHWEEKGTFTGAISPLMLKDLGCQYVIIGHSERRAYFHETDEMINKKIKAALKAGLRPILCVGEKERKSTDEEGRVVNDMDLVVGEQLEKDLNQIPASKIKNIMIAYEPVWAISAGAIGSGRPCLPDDAVKASLFIRKTLTKLYDRNTANKAVIIYGGSVSSQNITDYVKESAIRGALIGGASLVAADFIKIVNNVIDL